ncbi:AMP-binding protein [Halovenus sp. WSH3]|uniref:AMP-binding protein n=1 Tax=Halovenus carboxidivorans TaxID=2692199 RepID=A0A6B0SXX3_9EURY|nr:AMP-binding protein [Halovenus carboxidivorans]MXR50384.1 AMP-binding protein [Halovenus carboxidivorans]
MASHTLTAADTAADAVTLRALFEAALDKYAERDAITVDGETATYAELDRRANAVAHGLVERGVEREDRVALLMSNRLEFVIADLALCKAGATRLPLNDMLTAEEFRYMLDDAGAGTVVAGPQFVETVADLAGELPELETVIGVSDGPSLPEGVEAFDALDGSAVDPPQRPVDGDHIQGHYYTGGTTGKPKGVLQTHESMALNQYAHIAELGVSGDETLLLLTPLPHSAGLFLWAGLLTGAHAIIEEEFEPGTALHAIEDHGVTWTFMVPTMIYRLLDHDALDSTDTSSLSTLVYGAAPMTPARLREGIDAFGPVFLQFYGQTEVPNLITTFGKQEHARAVESGPEERLSSAGTVCLTSEVKIVDIQTGEELPPGEEGEILATAPYAMEEYFQRPEKTAETITDGWVHTGDVGKRDEDGYVYLLDRESDVIITGGMNVYSTEVEEAIAGHPDVAEVAVIGVPHDEWGEAVHAVVVADGVGAGEIRSYADERLADYKTPKSVEFVEEIPKTPYGKHDKVALRDRHWADEDRDIA